MHVNADNCDNNYSSNMHLLHVNADGLSSWSAFGLSSWWLEYLIGINLESVSWPTDSASYHFIMRLTTSSALNPTIRNSLLASCIFSTRSKNTIQTQSINEGSQSQRKQIPVPFTLLGVVFAWGCLTSRWERLAEGVFSLWGVFSIETLKWCKRPPTRLPPH